MKKPRADDALQKWILDDKGCLRSEAHPDLFVAFGDSLESDKGGDAKGKLGRKCTATVSSEAEGKMKKGQLHNLVVLMREKEVE